MEIINIEYQYTETEAVRSVKATIKSAFKFIAIMPWLGAVFLALALILASMQGKSVFDFSTLLSMGALLVSFPVLLVWIAKRNFRKDPFANKTIRWTFSEQGLKNETEGIETQLMWDKLIKVEERKSGFLLFIHPRVGRWIPKNSFRSDTEMNSFRNLVRNHGIKLKG